MKNWSSTQGIGSEMRANFLGLVFFLLGLSCDSFAEWKKELVWPMGTYNGTTFFNDIGDGFGPRNSGTEWFNTGVNIHLTGSVKCAYPPDTVNSGTHVAKVKALSAGNGGWVHLESMRPEHEARGIIYFNVDVNGSLIQVGNTFAGGATLPGVTVSSAPYLKFVVVPDELPDAHLTVSRTSVNPYKFLPYPNTECSNNAYTGSLGTEVNGDKYFQLEAQESRKCRVLDEIQLNFISDTIVNDRVVGLGRRRGKILWDLSNTNGTQGGTTWSIGDNVYHQGVKIDADDYSGNMITIRYRIYYRPASANSGKYAFTLKDVHGKIFHWRAKTNSAGCSGCRPDAPNFNSMQQMPTSSGRPGISFSIHRVNGADAYIVFRTDGLNYGHNSIQLGEQVGFFLDSSRISPPSPDTLIRVDPVSSSSPFEALPGASYSYAWATVDGDDVGCIGPFSKDIYATPPDLSEVFTCRPPSGVSCFDHCVSMAPNKNMTTTSPISGGLRIVYQDTAVLRFASDGGMMIKGRRGHFPSGISSGIYIKKGDSAVVQLVNSTITYGGHAYVGANLYGRIPFEVKPAHGMATPIRVSIFPTIPLAGLTIKSSDKLFYFTEYGRIGLSGDGPLQEHPQFW